MIKTDDVTRYGFDVVLQPLLADLQILNIARGHPIQLKNGNTIHINAALVAYVADNPAAHQAMGLKESVGGAFRKCRLCNADYDAMQDKFSEEDFDPNHNLLMTRNKF